MNPLRSPRRTRLLHIASSLMLAVVAGRAAAETNGIVGFSGKTDGMYCSSGFFGCHAAITPGGPLPPLVRFDGPTALAPGATGDFTFVVTSQAPETQLYAGLDVAASAGTLIVVPLQASKLSGGELTHTGPKANDNSGVASWAFQWKAPDAPGVYVLFGAGNSVDFSGTVDGDAGAVTTLMITVGDATPPTATATAPPDNTPTVTPVVSTCPGDCNGDGRVLVSELISSVNIALSRAEVGTCRACDLNGDGRITVNELVSAVSRALRGC